MYLYVYVYVVYLKIVNYHSIKIVYFFLQQNLKSINLTSKNQVFDCFSVQEDFPMCLSYVYVSVYWEA